MTITLEPKGKFLQIIAHTPCGRASFNTINNAEWHFVSWKARAFDRHKSGMFYRHFYGTKIMKLYVAVFVYPFHRSRFVKAASLMLLFLAISCTLPYRKLACVIAQYKGNIRHQLWIRHGARTFSITTLVNKSSSIKASHQLFRHGSASVIWH